jgi:hypothetical protein
MAVVSPPRVFVIRLGGRSANERIGDERDDLPEARRWQQR